MKFENQLEKFAVPDWHHKIVIFFRRYNPYVYSEHGIIALAAVL